MKQVEIEHIPDTEVVYIRRVGQYGAENNALMERMKSWAAKRGLLTEDAVIYAIALDNPQSVAPEMCRYDICLHTPNIKNVETDNQVKRRVITSGKYVVFKIEHTAKAVADFWTLFPTDMAKSEYKMDISRPIMERYSIVMVKHGCCEMCVPILMLINFVMNTKEILYVLLDKYAAHEMVFLSQAINDGEMGPRECPKYINKVVAQSMEPVTSISGTRTLSDYTFETAPKDYAALVLIGGHGWQNEVLADQVLPLVKEAICKGRIVGAICNAASWMAKQGFLNNIKHTGNGIDQLKLWAGENYTNEEGYVNEQAVSDGNIVTANGSGYLEFAKQLLMLLENDSPEMTERYYMFNKMGLVELIKMMTTPQPHRN